MKTRHLVVLILALATIPWAAAPAAAQNVNLAVGKTATQSSTQGGSSARPAGLAVDGNTDGNFYAGSVAHTDYQPQPWWQVDLGASYSISSVRIWNRTDFAGSRLANFDVRLSDDAQNWRDFNYPGTAGRDATISVSGNARYVRIQLRGSEYLQLAEVEVWGSPTPVAAAPPAGQACSWTGRWQRTENASIATLTQAGNQVTGDDGMGDEVSGTVAGNRFTGRWTHGSDSGAIELTMDSSCNRFSGTFGWPPGRAPDSWNGTRLGTAPTPVATTPPAPPQAAPPPTAPAPAAPQTLGLLDLDGYCRVIEYEFDLFGLTFEILPYDGAIPWEGVWYCASLDLFGSGIDVYSDPIDPHYVCQWQFGVPTAYAIPTGDDPAWACATAIAVVDLAGVSGLVRNARTGQPLAGAVVSAGGLTTTTGADGRYALWGLAPGTTNVTAAAEGYITDTETVSVPLTGAATRVFALSPGLAAGQLRIILTWGERPSDLDAHLWVGATHVYHGSRGSEGSPPYAQIDTDDRNGLGPETITVDQRASGTLIYAVHNYSNDVPFANAAARVQILREGRLEQAFTVPGGTGQWWYLFRIVGGTGGAITPVNALSDAPPTIDTPAPAPVAATATPTPAAAAPNITSLDCSPSVVSVNAPLTCIPSISGTVTSRVWTSAVSGSPSTPSGSPAGGTGTSFTTQYATPGSHTIRLQACNTSSCTSAERNVTVTSVATAIPTVTLPNLGTQWSVCEGLTSSTPPGCIPGTWTRQGATNTWSATWTNGATATLTITQSGRSVTVMRVDTNSTLRATYRGEVAADNVRITGTVDFCCDSLGNRSGVWAATIG